MNEDHEDTSVGGVTWHCSEPDGGPDVGISLYLGPNDRIWCGEIPSTTFEELEGKEHFGSDSGWFIVRYNPEPTLIAKCAEPHEAQRFIEQIALWVRESTLPTLAKTLADRQRRRTKQRRTV